MSGKKERIDRLEERLELLIMKHRGFVNEVKQLRAELILLKGSSKAEFENNPEAETSLGEKPSPFTSQEEAQKTVEARNSAESVSSSETSGATDAESSAPEWQAQGDSAPDAPKWDMEKFVGENLISKIGILITVIGVGIGVKYSIDHDLIGHLGRVILGYLFGLGLLAVGIKLKADYESYSAVLVSGAMAIMYFVTYTAYDFYGLIPQLLAFGTMAVFTVFTVFAALNYDKQVIAHIGLVGAYAIPFLLSSGSGRVDIMFTYMAMINFGILIVAIRKYWKALFFSAFVSTWIIYGYWYFTEFDPTFNLQFGMLFLFLFFAIFYGTFLGYKLRNNEKFQILDLVLLLANSFVFYGFGYFTLAEMQQSELLGLFTLANAIIHFIVSAVVYQKKLADRNLFFLVSGLVLVFITIAVPVQLDGDWVSLLWAGEAALLFWIGRVQNVRIYEWMSYVLVVLAFGCIYQSWAFLSGLGTASFDLTDKWAFINGRFLSALFSALAFGAMTYWQINHKGSISENSPLRKAMFYALPAFFLITLYQAFAQEIAWYWGNLYSSSQVLTTLENGRDRMLYNHDYRHFGELAGFCFSMFFLSVLAFVNMQKIKSNLLGIINVGLILAVLGFFFLDGLFVLERLRMNYLDNVNGEFFHRGIANLLVRYVCYAFVALVLYVIYSYRERGFAQGLMTKKVSVQCLDAILYGSLLVLASTELINWMEIGRSNQSFKLGLSILWGVYALFLIVVGIWKGKKHLRIGAMVLFALTLVKLFFYDIIHLDTISKTIVFVSLGLLLLVISFLYNKYKDQIFDEED